MAASALTDDWGDEGYSVGAYYDSQGFYIYADGSFLDPDGYYFDKWGYDELGGHYDDSNIYHPPKEMAFKIKGYLTLSKPAVNRH